MQEQTTGACQIDAARIDSQRSDLFHPVDLFCIKQMIYGGKQLPQRSQCDDEQGVERIEGDNPCQKAPANVVLSVKVSCISCKEKERWDMKSINKVSKGRRTVSHDNAQNQDPLGDINPSNTLAVVPVVRL